MMFIYPIHDLQLFTLQPRARVWIYRSLVALKIVTFVILNKAKMTNLIGKEKVGQVLRGVQVLAEHKRAATTSSLKPPTHPVEI